MLQIDLRVEDVEAVMTGQSKFLPLADGRVATLQLVRSALHLRIFEKDDILADERPAGEGEAP